MKVSVALAWVMMFAALAFLAWALTQPDLMIKAIALIVGAGCLVLLFKKKR